VSEWRSGVVVNVAGAVGMVDCWTILRFSGFLCLDFDVDSGGLVCFL